MVDFLESMVPLQKSEEVVSSLLGLTFFDWNWTETKSSDSPELTEEVSVDDLLVLEKAQDSSEGDVSEADWVKESVSGS